MSAAQCLGCGTIVTDIFQMVVRCPARTEGGMLALPHGINPVLFSQMINENLGQLNGLGFQPKSTVKDALLRQMITQVTYSFLLAKGEPRNHVLESALQMDLLSIVFHIKKEIESRMSRSITRYPIKEGNN